MPLDLSKLTAAGTPPLIETRMGDTGRVAW